MKKSTSIVGTSEGDQIALAAIERERASRKGNNENKVIADNEAKKEKELAANKAQAEQSATNSNEEFWNARERKIKAAKELYDKRKELENAQRLLKSPVVDKTKARERYQDAFNAYDAATTRYAEAEKELKKRTKK